MFIFPNMTFAIDYTEQDKLVREKVWGWDLPQFKNYTVPEKYKNESAVIIARHKLVEVKRQKNFASIMQSGGFSPSLKSLFRKRLLQRDTIASINSEQ